MYAWIWKWTHCELYFFMFTDKMNLLESQVSVAELTITAEEVGQMLGGN